MVKSSYKPKLIVQLRQRPSCLCFIQQVIMEGKKVPTPNFPLTCLLDASQQPYCWKLGNFQNSPLWFLFLNEIFKINSSMYSDMNRQG